MKKILFIIALLCNVCKLFADVTDNGQTVIIPVVVHIFYSKTDLSYTITKEQVNSQIVAMNKDYTATNGDFIKLQQFDNTWGTNFSSVAAGPPNSANGVGVQFELAKRNPQNEGTDGIEYIEFTGSTCTLEYKGLGGGWNISAQQIWDNQKYLNIFVAPTVISDGVNVRGATYNKISCVRYTCFGTLDINTPEDIPFVPPGFLLDAQYKEGGILTHEVGHFFGLSHPFPSDFFSDTPPQPNANNGCTEPYIQNNITTMSMNYMDYPDDPCIYMFTMQQRNHVRYHLFNNPTMIPLIDPSLNTALAPVLCDKPLYVNAQIIPYPAKVNLTWEGSPNDLFRVKIYNASYDQIVYSTTVQGTDLISNILWNNTPYYAKVYRQCADGGYSEPQISAEFIIPNLPPCPPATNLNYTLNYGAKSATITWDGDSTVYEIKEGVAQPYTVIGNTVTIDNLSYGSNTNMKITTKCIHENSTISSIIVSFPAPCPLVSNVVPSLADENKVHVTWSSSIPPALSDSAKIYNQSNNQLVQKMISYNKSADFAGLEYNQDYKVVIKSNCIHESSNEIVQLIKTCPNDPTEPNDNSTDAEPIVGLTTASALANGVNKNISICKMNPVDEDWFTFITGATNYANIEVKILNEAPGITPVDMYIHRQSGSYTHGGRWVASGPITLLASKTGTDFNEFIYRPCGGTRYKYYIQLVRDPSSNSAAVSVDRVLNVKLFWDYSPVCPVFRTSAENMEENIVQSNIHVYPNPGNGLFNIESDIDITSVYVTDLYGKTMMSQTFSDSKIHSIDLSSYASGIYLIYINEKISRPVKVVKE
jgi:hypothetical protein